MTAHHPTVKDSPPAATPIDIGVADIPVRHGRLGSGGADIPVRHGGLACSLASSVPVGQTFLSAMVV
jgi:hypothetical protein